LPKLEGDIRVQVGKFAERIFLIDKELPAELAKGKLRQNSRHVHHHQS
jgi:hypothetical protein